MHARQWPLFQPGEWDQPFLIALGLSVLLHTFVLSLSLTQRAPGRNPGASSLNVVLAGKSSPGTTVTAVPESSESEKSSRAIPLTVREETSASIRKQHEETGRSGAERRISNSTVAGRGSSATADQNPAGRETRPALKPGEVSVIVLIRDDGHVGQILWDKMPAMTDAQLYAVEAAIRARKLPGAMSGQVRTETINIQALLDELEGRKHAPEGSSP